MDKAVIAFGAADVPALILLGMESLTGMTGIPAKEAALSLLGLGHGGMVGGILMLPVSCVIAYDACKRGFYSIYRTAVRILYAYYGETADYIMGKIECGLWSEDLRDMANSYLRELQDGGQ